MRFFKLLWRNKFFIVLTPITVCGFIYGYFSLSPNLYRSSAIIEPRLSGHYDAEVQAMELIEMMNSDIPANLLSYKLLVHDLSTQDPFRKVGEDEITEIFKYYPDIYYSSLNPFDDLRKELNYRIENFLALDQNVEYNRLISDIVRLYEYDRPSLLNTLEIKRNQFDSITVGAMTENAELSAFIVNNFSKEFIRYYNRQKASSEEHNDLERLLSEKKRILDEKTSELNEAKRNASVNLNLDYKIGQLKDFTIKKDNLLDEIRSLQMQIESVNQKIRETQDAESARLANTRIIQLQTKINEINQLYVSSGSNNPELENTLESLRTELRSEMSRAAASSDGPTASIASLSAKKEDLELKLRITRTNLQSIENNISDLNKNISGMSTKQTSFQALEAEVKRAMDAYLAALDSFNLAKKTTQLKATLTLVKPAIPAKPDFERQIRIYAIGAGGSTAIVILLVLLTGLADTTIRNARKFKNKTRMKLAGVINEINSDQIDLARLFAREQDDEEYETFKQLLRKIRNEILSYKEDKIFLFTSLKKAEGKSFLILCLSYSLSLMNKKVLIIDTNFKNNTLTQILSPEAIETSLLELKRKLITDPDFGRSPALDHKDVEMLEAFNPEYYDENQSRVIPVHDNIDIIGSKRVNHSPSEIFAGKDFDILLLELAQQYDYIFMEGPALNDYSDTHELAAYADKVVPIFSAKTSLKQRDRDSIGYLKKLNGKLTNVVLNRVGLDNL